MAFTETQYTTITSGHKAAFTPAQHVAQQHDARNTLLVARMRATSNMLLVVVNKIVARNMLRWCKRGLRKTVLQLNWLS